MVRLCDSSFFLLPIALTHYKSKLRVPGLLTSTMSNAQNKQQKFPHHKEQVINLSLSTKTRPQKCSTKRFFGPSKLLPSALCIWGLRSQLDLTFFVKKTKKWPQWWWLVRPGRSPLIMRSVRKDKGGGRVRHENQNMTMNHVVQKAVCSQRTGVNCLVTVHTTKGWLTDRCGVCSWVFKRLLSSTGPTQRQQSLWMAPLASPSHYTHTLWR